MTQGKLDDSGALLNETVGKGAQRTHASPTGGRGAPPDVSAELTRLKFDAVPKTLPRFIIEH